MPNNWSEAAVKQVGGNIWGKFLRRSLSHRTLKDQSMMDSPMIDTTEINAFWFKSIFPFTFPHFTELIP